MRAAVNGRGVCLGLTVAGSEPCLSWFNDRAKQTVLRLNEWVRMKLREAGRKDFRWTSIQLNVDTVAELHCDKNNEGPSLIITIGDYEGGEFQMQGTQKVNLDGGLWLFDGNKPHRSFPFQGTRCSLIWFAHSSWKKAPEDKLKSLEELGFHLPREVEEVRKPDSTKMEDGQIDYNRPIANLAFFEGVGSMAIVLKRLTCNVVAHLSWETDEVTKDFLAWRFPASMAMGDANESNVQTIEEALRRLSVPDNTLVVISGGPPCVDHSRIKKYRARQDKGPEGKKLANLARFVSKLKEGLPWECRFLVEHVVHWGNKSIACINQIWGVKAVVADAADLGLIRKPRVWWTDAAWGNELKWTRTGMTTCPWKLQIDGVVPLAPKDANVGSIDGVKYKLPWQVRSGISLLPCPTRQSDEKGWSLPPATDLTDWWALKRHKEDGQSFAPWHYKERAMLHPINKAAPLKVLSNRVKQQAQMFPQDFLEAPILREVKDPDRTKANWLANAWHLGVAEFLTKQLLRGDPKAGVSWKQAAVAETVGPKWISPWGGSKLDQVKILVPAFGVRYEALPRRLKMGAARAI